MFSVIQDTREQQPFQFTIGEIVDGVIKRKLITGDYSIDGMEDLLCIERKKSVGELANNIKDSRFHRELIRISQFKYKYLILEFDYETIKNYPNDIQSRYIRSKIKMTGSSIMKFIGTIVQKYGIEIITNKNKNQAAQSTLNIMIDVYRREYGEG